MLQISEKSQLICSRFAALSDFVDKSGLGIQAPANLRCHCIYFTPAACFYAARKHIIFPGAKKAVSAGSRLRIWNVCGMLGTQRKANDNILEVRQNNMECVWQKVSFETARKMMDETSEYLILDVREEEEYITGHADGAVLFPLDTINAETAAALIASKDMLIFAYCRSGRRSQQAAARLAELGYTKVYDLGSLVGWPYGMAW